MVHLAACRFATSSLDRLAARGSATFRSGIDSLARLPSHVSLAPLRAARDRVQPALRRTFADAYAHDERRIILVFVLPFLLLATAVVVHQSASTLFAYVNLTATETPDTEIASVRPNAAKASLAPAAQLAPSTAHTALPRAVPPSATPLATVADAPDTGVSEWTSVPQLDHAAAAPDSETRELAVADTLDTLKEPASSVGTVGPQSVALAAKPQTAIASLRPGSIGRRAVRPLPFTPRSVPAFEADENGRPIFPGLCTVAEAEHRPLLVTGAVETPTGGPVATRAAADFGTRLARAAEAQTASFVIYDDAYRSIAYPMGDVHRMFGVCTDLIVRAYRALGIDLQSLVHRARSGRGDRNIDHRRTEVLRRFFAAHGESLPVSSFAEDYRPGDIVTYHRPQNSGSRSHIAIVSSQIAASGRPMIVHNRGWGPQIEDALFVDRITGHYRYRGPDPARRTVEEGPRLGLPAPEASAPIPANDTATAIPISLP